MKVAIIGKGLIGGSIEKSAKRAGHDAVILRGRGFAQDAASVATAAAVDIAFVATPPDSVAEAVDALGASGLVAKDTVVIDIAGVKRPIYDACAKHSAFFVPGHPMAGKEKPGYENSCETLFDGASMILTPYPSTREATLVRLEAFFRSLGFSRVVRTDPDNHDRMIAFTSQLCHLISSAYVRDPLSAEHFGYSAGSFRDMVRVGAPDPATWTQLFMDNRDALIPVLEKYVARLDDFLESLKDGDSARMRRALDEGPPAKSKIDNETLSEP